MTAPTLPKLTINLGATSAIEHAALAPYVLNGGFASGALRQLEANCKRKFALEVAPYDLTAARGELEAEAEKHSAAMARSPLVAKKVRDLLDKADQTDDVMAIASVIHEVKLLSNSPLFWG